MTLKHNQFKILELSSRYQLSSMKQLDTMFDDVFLQQARPWACEGR